MAISQQPFRPDRRMLLAGGLMLPGMAAAARLAPPDDKVNESAIRWPAGDGRDLHGFMAIPARARGRQPAVLVIGGPDLGDAATRALVRSVAQAGFVACTLNAASYKAGTLPGDLRATVTWLAKGRYGTGRVGGVGMARGAALASSLIDDAALAAAVMVDAPGPSTQAPTILSLRAEGPGWTLSAGSDEPTKTPDWAEAWMSAMTFLRQHLT